MGGLVARTLAEDPRVEGCIQSVTTVSTPNQGTPLAEWAEEHVNDGDIIGDGLNLFNFTPDDVRYLRELKVDRTGADPALFRSQNMKNNPKVTYYSVSNSMAFIPIVPLDVARQIIGQEVRDRHLDNTKYKDRNDGIVPEYSMLLPGSTYLGHLEVHHWGSACVDPVRYTIECLTASHFLEKHFKKIYPN
jgi:hypothetical protein